MLRGKFQNGLAWKLAIGIVLTITLTWIIGKIVYDVRFGVPTEDYEVYSAAIQYLCRKEYEPPDWEDSETPFSYFWTKYDDKQIVIENRTIDLLRIDLRHFVIDYWDFFEISIPSDVWDDYSSNNSSERTFIQSKFNLPWRTTLIPSSRFRSDFSEKFRSVMHDLAVFLRIKKPPRAGSTGWDEFYEKYPDAQGIMTLSRVGFSADHSKAILGISNYRYIRASADVAVYLEKENGDWQVVLVAHYGGA